jgi:predicted amidohydrolase
MNKKEITEIKENLIQSTDIFNLLANLYFICATEFTTIYNLIQNEDDYKERFGKYFHNFKHEMLDISLDFFDSNLLSMKHLLRKMNVSNAEDFLISLWAFLRAIDLIASDEANYLKTFKTIRCRTSNYFGSKEFILLFKPKNLIFDTIKSKIPEGKIKIGFNIGQRIEDHLQKLIIYEENLSRKIEIQTIDPLVNELLLEQGENLAFAVAPISYDFNYAFKPFNSSQGVPYVFDEIRNWEKIARLIDSVLKKCILEDIHIVVFPELSIDEKLRAYVSNWLKNNNKGKKIIMVVAGSYHVLKENQKDKYENSSIVYRFDGKKLWEQKKMNQFQMDENDLKKFKSSSEKGFKELRRLIKKSSSKSWEKIDISNKLIIYDSSIGRMAVTICLDYFVKEKEKLLIEPHVNLIFVPSMSRSLRRMNISNLDYGTFGLGSIFCANSCWVISGGEKNNFRSKNASYIYIPKREGLIRSDCQGKCDCQNCNFTFFRITQVFENNLQRGNFMIP